MLITARNYQVCRLIRADNEDEGWLSLVEDDKDWRPSIMQVFYPLTTYFWSPDPIRTPFLKIPECRNEFCGLSLLQTVLADVSTLNTVALLQYVLFLK